MHHVRMCGFLQLHGSFGRYTSSGLVAWLASIVANVAPMPRTIPGGVIGGIFSVQLTFVTLPVLHRSHEG
jgi:hypothetical protein